MEASVCVGECIFCILWDEGVITSLQQTIPSMNNNTCSLVFCSMTKLIVFSITCTDEFN